MKEENVVKSKKRNAYLFVNLVLIAILLIAIWTTKGNEILAQKLDVGNLLLLVIIFNTILLFKKFIVSSHSSSKHQNSNKSTQKLKSLNPLRAFVNSSSTSNPKLLSETVDKLKEIADCEYVEIAVIENALSNTLVSSGNQPQLLSGTRLSLINNVLSIKHSGQLGSEEITTLTDEYKPIKFKSAVTHLRLVIVPLNLSHARTGLCLFFNSKAPYRPQVSLNNLAVFFESLIAMIENTQNSQGGYKDKETGLILYKNYEELVDNELERSERYEQEMSLLTIKITDFDKLQDSEKPVISKNIASAMKHSLRRFDLMFYGKEPGSYYALLTESGIEVAEGIARRLQKEFNKLIKKLQFTDEKKPVLVIGSATYQTDATHSVGLIEKSADACANAIENKVDFKSFSEVSETKKKAGVENERRRKKD